jgi:uncharacterized membrane protein YkoI
MVGTRIVGRMLASATLAVAALAVQATADEVEIKFADCPAAVQKTLTREALGTKIEEVEKDTDDGKTVYEAEVKIDGKEYEIVVAEDGTLLEKSLDDEDDEDEDEGEEVEVKLSDCPAAVRKTLEREAFGSAIDEVTKLTDDGKSIYEADVTIDGKEYEVIVAENGTLLSKELEEDE